jgi:nucleoside-diphosphate-sugar epimerase
MKINVIITGATGMVGKGVLLECLESPEVGSVQVLVRTPTGLKHEKLKELIPVDFYNLSGFKNELKGYQACFFCLGVSALGLNEEQYTKITYQMTLHFARTLLDLNPDMVFSYVSGTGTDSTEKGRSMWARVKGKTENAILNMGFRDAYAFRPGLILPEKGIRSRTGWYNALYTAMKPLIPWLKRQAFATTTARVGQAMIRTAIDGYDKKHLENKDINLIAS